MDGYKAELVAVKQELADIEGELDQLLRRQSELLDKKDDLEKLIKQSVSTVCNNDTQWDRTDFKWSKNLIEKQQSVFHITKLRPMQLQTMNVTMSGKDCILIMPTGGGKSLCFQLPALLTDGVTLVVSPLVSLMEDQVMALRGYNVSCNLLNASTDKETLKQVQDAMTDKKASLKLLYVTPEKLAKSKRFMAKLEKMYQVGRFSRLVIDEVHCCSQWGHDFRPDYKFLGIMKRQFPGVPILGLTATATTHVLDDVKKILNIQDCQLFRASFNRPNLYYEVRNKPSAHKEVMEDIVKLISSRFHHKSGIIYTFSKKEAEDVTVELQSRGVKAGCYHADLNARERSRVHRAWIENSVHVVVATIAFGMGIDKPDVRFVIHHSLSKSMENFYQESGRAGRDDKTSHCILYYRFQDTFRQSAMVMAEQTGLRNLYGIMEYCVDIGKCRRSMIARYFGEVWERSQCNKMCDHCNSDYTIEKKDITQLCVSVLKLIENASSANQKLTATKLLDAWQGKGATILRVKGTDTSTDRDKLERILAFMLMNNYIREDFHFTPYSTISYLMKGDKARLISSGTQKLYLEMPGKRKQGTENSHTNSTATSYGFQNCSKSDKPKLVVINSEKSAFSSFSGTQSESLNGDNNSGTLVLRKESADVKKLKKRKKPILDSDSDSDGLDFGSDDTSFKIKKRKSDVSSEKSTTQNQKQSNKGTKISKKCTDKSLDSGSKNSFISPSLTNGEQDVLDLTSDVEELNNKGDHSPVLGKKKTIQTIDSDSDFE